MAKKSFHSIIKKKSKKKQEQLTTQKKTYQEIAENSKENIFNGNRFMQSCKLAHNNENSLRDQSCIPENFPEFWE